jgi:hypothetical protein
MFLPPAFGVVVPGVFSLRREDLKVRRSVVALISVLVMNDFIWFERPAEYDLGDDTMEMAVPVLDISLRTRLSPHRFGALFCCSPRELCVGFWSTSPTALAKN